MTNRENFFSLIRRQGYEWIPPEFHLCPHLENIFVEKYGRRDYDEFFRFPWKNVDDMRLSDTDTEKFRKYYQKPLAENADLDIWGIGHEKSPNSMHMTYMRHPLENAQTLEEVMDYPYPDFLHADRSHQAGQVRQIKEHDQIAMGNMQTTIWETAWYLRSMEELFCDMMEGSEIADFLFDKVAELSTARALSYVDAGVDALYFGDDIGMQHTTLMSEALYCRYLKPRLAKLIQTVKDKKNDVIIFYHSCGFIEPFIPHLIEAGVDVLNPIQSECMEFENIHAQYKNRISFHGTIGTQTVMPHGTVEEVKKQVWNNLNIAGEQGGLLVAPTHMLEPEVPWENVEAYVDACRTYRR